VGAKEGCGLLRFYLPRADSACLSPPRHLLKSDAGVRVACGHRSTCRCWRRRVARSCGLTSHRSGQQKHRYTRKHATRTASTKEPRGTRWTWRSWLSRTRRYRQHRLTAGHARAHQTRRARLYSRRHGRVVRCVEVELNGRGAHRDSGETEEEKISPFVWVSYPFFLPFNILTSNTGRV
jgi:hypothetical protein